MVGLVFPDDVQVAVNVVGGALLERLDEHRVDGKAAVNPRVNLGPLGFRRVNLRERASAGAAELVSQARGLAERRMLDTEWVWDWKPRLKRVFMADVVPEKADTQGGHRLPRGRGGSRTSGVYPIGQPLSMGSVIACRRGKLKHTLIWTSDVNRVY